MTTATGLSLNDDWEAISEETATKSIVSIVGSCGVGEDAGTGASADTSSDEGWSAISGTFSVRSINSSIVLPSDSSEQSRPGSQGHSVESIASNDHHGSSSYLFSSSAAYPPVSIVAPSLLFESSTNEDESESKAPTKPAFPSGSVAACSPVSDIVLADYGCSNGLGKCSCGDVANDAPSSSPRLTLTRKASGGSNIGDSAAAATIGTGIAASRFQTDTDATGVDVSRAVLQHLYQAETTARLMPYMDRQEDINERMRANLIDWLVDVHMRFRLLPETLYLCVNIIDRYCARADVDHSRLRLVGVTALFLACKFKEISPLGAHDCVDITDGTYDMQEFLDTKFTILGVLDKVVSLTAYPFLDRFLVLCSASPMTRHAAAYYLERTLQEHDLLEFRPSVVCASAVVLALNNPGIRDYEEEHDRELPGLPILLMQYTGFDRENLMACMEIVANKVSEPSICASSRDLTAVRKKYAQKKYLSVSSEIDPPSICHVKENTKANAIPATKETSSGVVAAATTGAATRAREGVQVESGEGALPFLMNRGSDELGVMEEDGGVGRLWGRMAERAATDAHAKADARESNSPGSDRRPSFSDTIELVEDAGDWLRDAKGHSRSPGRLGLTPDDFEYDTCFAADAVEFDAQALALMKATAEVSIGQFPDITHNEWENFTKLERDQGRNFQATLRLTVERQKRDKELSDRRLVQDAPNPIQNLGGTTITGLRVPVGTMSTKRGSSDKVAGDLGEAFYAKSGMCGFADALNLDGKLDQTSSVGLDRVVDEKRDVPTMSECAAHGIPKPIEEVYKGVHDGPVLGSGMSGIVRLVTHRATGLEYAAKCLDLGLSGTSKEGLKMIHEQICILSQLSHPNIARLKEVYETSSEIYIVQELCAGGELYDRLDEQPEYHFSETQCARLIKQMLCPVQHIHSKGIIHRNLALENFLFSNTKIDSELKMVGFGSSKRFECGEVQQDKVGTPYTVAPEVIEGSYDEKCDVWAIGIMTYMLLCGESPFGGCGGDEPLSQVRDNILHGNFAFEPEEIWESVSLKAKDFVKRLLAIDPNLRPTAREAQEDPWLLEMKNNDGH